VVTTATSSKDLKKLSNSLSSKQFLTKNNLVASVKTMTKISKVQSAVDCSGKTLMKSKSYALKPFPTVNPEFYQETEPNYFWQKELSRISSEKSFMNKTSQSLNRSKTDGNAKIFYNSVVFENKKTKKVLNQTSERTYLKKPKNVVIDLYRVRDYHSHTNVINPLKSKNEEDVGKRNSNKAISPMHLKLYSSTMQKNVTNVSLPSSHPSYDKDPIKKEVLPPPKKKKLELLKTNYNFLKNYY